MNLDNYFVCNESLDGLNDSSPFLLYSILFAAVHQDKLIYRVILILLSWKNIVHERKESADIIVQLLSLCVDMHDLWIHDLLINLWNQRDDKVEQDDVNQDHIGQPNNVD